MTQQVKAIINKGGSAEEIKRKALEEGMSTLRMSAAEYVIDGITSISEMMRAAFEI